VTRVAPSFLDHALALAAGWKLEQPMTRDDKYEPNRVFGMPRTQEPYARQGEAPQRVMGMPVDWIGPVARDLTWSLAHPIRGYRRWRLRRRLGPYAPDDGPGKSD
jgi:hypothetical protein